MSEPTIVVEHWPNSTFGAIYTIVEHPSGDAWENRTLSPNEIGVWLASQKEPVLVRPATPCSFCKTGASTVRVGKERLPLCGNPDCAAAYMAQKK